MLNVVMLILLHWGENNDSQCGHGMSNVEYIYQPKLIKSIKESVVDCIDCGDSHSYVRTTDNQHYLFGLNFHGQCITYNDKKKVNAPFRVDQIIKRECRAKKIIEIAPGFGNTKVTVSI